jgi:hypothetical protein
VEIRRAGQADQVKRDLKGIDAAGAKAGTSIAGVNKVLGLLGVGLSVAAVGRFLKSTVANAIDAERALDNLAISVENTGTSFQSVQAAMDGAANNLQRLTRFGDEQARDALAALTRITGDAAKATELLGITADVAAATQMDLVSASERVGRLLNGETSVLKRYGIVIGENEDALTGLRRVVGGFAETEAKGLGVQLMQIRNEFGDVLEAIGQAIIGGSDFAGVAQRIKDALEDAEQWVLRNQRAIASWTQIVVQSFGVGVQMVDLFGTTISSTFKLVGDILGNIGALLVGVFTLDVTLIKTALGELKSNVVTDTQAIRDELVETADGFLALARAIQVAAGASGGGPVRQRTPGRGTAVAPAPGDAPNDPKALIADALADNDRWLRLNEEQLQRTLDGIITSLGFVTQATLEAARDAAVMIQQGLAQTLGDAIFNGLSAAFETGSLKAFFAEFGKTLLAGFGQILVQLGRVLIQYGLTMEGLRPLLMNIFTAGPAAIAAGAALIALGSAFTKVASGGGGVGRGTATAGAFREPRFAGAQNEVTFRSIFPGTGGNVQSKPAFAPTFVLIGEKDPQVQRQLAGIVRSAWERGIG